MFGKQEYLEVTTELSYKRIADKATADGACLRFKE